MTSKEIIEFLIEEKANGKAKTFCEETGISESTVSKIRSGVFGRSGLGRFVGKICKAYPDVNPEWVMTGEGPTGIADRHNFDDLYLMVSQLRGEIEELRKQIRIVQEMLR